jgi:methionyl-tRNA formyltransferase
MRIVVIGQAAFGESVLNALADRGETVVAAWCPPDGDGRRVDRLKAASEKQGVPVFQFKRMRDREAIDAFRGLNSDLCVMAFVTDIVPADIVTAPTHGTIQYHPSLLPKHRGPSSINWPIIQGESRTGLTVFWPDEGLDTGPVLLQKAVDIGSEDTLGSLYFDKLFPLGVDAMVEAVDMVRDGTAPRTVQDESQATYEGWCRPEDVIIDWGRPLGEIYDLIRGSDPSPGAGTTYRGGKIRLYGTERGQGDTSRDPGEVAEVSDRGFAVAAQGGRVFVRRVQPEGEGKTAAGEWAASIGLKAGDRFGA